MLTLILLTFSTVAVEPPNQDLKVRFIDQGPGKAPAVSPRPDGMPLALKVPEEVRCIDLKGSLLAGTFLPAPLDLYVARRDLALDLCPAAAQRKLDEGAAVWAKRLENAVADASCGVDQERGQAGGRGREHGRPALGGGGVDVGRCRDRRWRRGGGWPVAAGPVGVEN